MCVCVCVSVCVCVRERERERERETEREREKREILFVSFYCCCCSWLLIRPSAPSVILQPEGGQVVRGQEAVLADRLFGEDLRLGAIRQDKEGR